MKTKQKTVYKTVCQYNAEDIPETEMKKLQEIAKDYCKGWTQGETWNAFRIFLSGSF